MTNTDRSMIDLAATYASAVYVCAVVSAGLFGCYDVSAKTTAIVAVWVLCLWGWFCGWAIRRRRRREDLG